MQLCFRNSYTSPVWVAVGWYDPSGCAGDAGEWGKRGWWQVNPGSTVTTNVSTSNENFYFYAEAQDGTVWGGPLVAQVSIYAFDGCLYLATSQSSGPSPYFDVGFQLVDAGFWYWTYSTYTVDLT